MEIVKNWMDLIKLKQKALVPAGMILQMEKLLVALHQSLGGECAIDSFSLDKHGPIAVLPPGERRLAALGLNYDINESWPEVVTVYELNDGTAFYTVCLMMDNDFMFIIYLFGEIENDLREWLDSYAEKGEDDDYHVCPATEPF